jgi:WD repeat-containing protein 19
MKGNLLIYNKSRKQKIPIVGKHSKRITCGNWSLTGNKLVLASDDKTLTISNDNGDTLLQTDLRHMATEAKFTLTEKNANDSGRDNNGGGDRGGESKFNGSSSKDDILISANLNGKSLLLYNIMDEKEDPLELTFAPKDNGNGCRYGDLIKHMWYNEDSVLVGFSDGYLLSVSTSPKELGEEKYCAKLHSEDLYSFSFNPFLKKVASAGNDGVRVIDSHNFKENLAEYIPIDDLEGGKITNLNWSPDGQILTIATSHGNIYNFLAKMSVLFTSYKSSIAYLSSLREISVVDGIKRGRPIDITVKLEPSLIAVGDNHVAAGMNNRVYYHRIKGGNGSGNKGGRDGDDNPPVNEQEYIGIVKEIQLNNEYAVILTDSKAILHPIEPSKEREGRDRNKGGGDDRDGGSGKEGGGNREMKKTFPSREEGSYAKVTCIALTDNFLFYGTEGGTVETFFLSEWTLLSGIELRLDNPIKKIFPNNNGTRLVIIDGANQCFLYNPVNGSIGGLSSGGGSSISTGGNKSITRFDGTPSIIINVLWDIEEKNIIMFYDGSSCIHTYIYVTTSIEGTKLLKLGPVSVSSVGEIAMKPDKIELSSGNIPILASFGVLTCQTSNGNLSTIVHPFFDTMDGNKGKGTNTGGGKSGKYKRKGEGFGDDDNNGMNEDRMEFENKSNQFCQCLALNKLEKAWQLAIELNKRSFFLALSHKAMELLNVELAYRVYTQLGDAGMVMALKQCFLVEDKNLLAGKLTLFLFYFPCLMYSCVIVCLLVTFSFPLLLSPSIFLCRNYCNVIW